MRRHLKDYLFAILFAVFIIFSFLFDFEVGRGIFENFFSFFLTMIKFVPAVFILIGLFDVWVDKKLIEKHLGEDANFMSYIWALVFASTTVGGLYVAFPVSTALYKKGASPRIIFTYIGAAAICRIPMTLFEASYVGIKFTVLRWTISIPLIIISSIILEKMLSDTELAKIGD